MMRLRLIPGTGAASAALADPISGPRAAAGTIKRPAPAGPTAALADPIPGPRAKAATMTYPALAGPTAWAGPIPAPRAAAAALTRPVLCAAELCPYALSAGLPGHLASPAIWPVLASCLQLTPQPQGACRKR